MKANIINAIAKEAGAEIKGVEIFVNGQDVDDVMYKFAELIIKHCCTIVSDEIMKREPASTYVDTVKDYFGVHKV